MHSDSQYDQLSRISRKPYTPGYDELWLVIGGYQLTFSAFFLVYAHFRNLNLDVFLESQALLSQNAGFVNTLILLTSSWFAAMALHLHRKDMKTRAQRMVELAIFCGIVFSIIKGFEYYEKINAGYTVYSNEFFTFYYLLTGLHLLHVWLGLFGLAAVWVYFRKQKFSKEDTMIVESCVGFWHMVDFLWIIIFALFYLIK
ncbi:cytochrome c oxidase subunit 3 [Alteromonas sp. M12]|uniref:cytochrome c oxidase subunit 3 n=1 Tax=Alteromonas sp. M12 TaxID=3135644 RepID=UPI00319E23C5